MSRGGNGVPQADDGGEQVLITDDRNMQVFDDLFGGLELFEKICSEILIIYMELLWKQQSITFRLMS